MESHSRKPEESPHPSVSHDRLDSWKEIAAYFDRNVRTVQLWEKHDGLPVRRRGNTSGSVYAYRSELDAWLKEKSSRTGEPPRPERSFDTRRKIVAYVLSAAFALSLSVLAAALWMRYETNPTFQERDWVLIAEFENETAETLFDGMVEAAMEWELANSRFLNVVPRERVRDVLYLMQKPDDAVVDAGLGREICLRDGAIRALITGRVEKLEPGYLLSVRAMEPSSGATVVSATEEAHDLAGIRPAVRRLSSDLRRGLGESLAHLEKSNVALEKVTTPSLQALEFYTHGRKMLDDGDPSARKAAIALLARAVDEDPDFASAHIYLAHAYSNASRHDEGLEHYEAAYALSNRVTDRERHFIRGSYYQRVLKDVDRAIAEYEALLRLHPDDWRAANNLGFAYLRQRKPAEAIRYFERASSLRPYDFRLHFLTGHHLAIIAKDPSRAAPYLERAREIAARSGVGPHRYSILQIEWAETYPVFEHWLSGDFEGMKSEMKRLEAGLGHRLRAEEDVRFELLGMTSLMLGRLNEAETWFQKLSRESERESALAAVSLARADLSGFESHLEGAASAISELDPEGIHDSYFIGRYGHLLVAGDTGIGRDIVRLETWLEGPLKRSRIFRHEYLTLMKAERALAERRLDEALPMLEAAVDELQKWGGPAYFLGSETLARAWEAQRNTERAIHVLERAWQDQVRTYPFGAFFWMRAGMRLAALYREAGRDPEAHAIERELRQLLALADADHVIARTLGSGRATEMR